MRTKIIITFVIVLSALALLCCSSPVTPPSNTVINIAAIPGVTAPVTGATPVMTITETAQYTGTVAWNGSPTTFAASTVYTATITLTAKAGYTLTGVAANFFTVAGATATNPVNFGVVTAVFPVVLPANSIVQRNSIYTVVKTTHTYAQALSHSSWNGASPTTTVNLELDLYLPENAPTNRPAMIIIHGGGFNTGSKDDSIVVANANYFASRGWVCISINYRLSAARGTISVAWYTYVLNNIPVYSREQSYAMYPAARDAKAALRWLHAHAANYGINSNSITALGGSAGAFLANMLGVTNASDFRDETLTTNDATLSTTNLSASSSIHTIIDHWGGLHHMTFLKAIDGQSRFDANDPPISIVHGTADTVVPFSQAEALRDEYISTGVPYAFHPLEGVGHAAWSAIIDGQSLSENAFDFIVAKQNLIVQE